MLNIEKYKDEILENWSKSAKLEDAVAKVYMKATNQGNDYFLQEGIVGWLCEEYQEPILDEEEKKYLSAVIKPFRDRISSIRKWKYIYDEGKEFVAINYDEDNFKMILPIFKAGTMYKDMELNKQYTLEELGL